MDFDKLESEIDKFKISPAVLIKKDLDELITHLIIKIQSNLDNDKILQDLLDVVNMLSDDNKNIIFDHLGLQDKRNLLIKNIIN